MQKKPHYRDLSHLCPSDRRKNQRGITIVSAMIAAAMLATGAWIMTVLMTKQFDAQGRDAQKEEIQGIYNFARDQFDCCKMFEDVVGSPTNYNPPAGLDTASIAAADCDTLEADWSLTDPDVYSGAGGSLSWPMKNSSGEWIFLTEADSGPFSGNYNAVLRCRGDARKQLELFVKPRGEAKDAFTGKSTAGFTNEFPGMKFCTDIFEEGYVAACSEDNAGPPPFSNPDTCTDCMSFGPVPSSTGPIRDISMHQNCGEVTLHFNVVNPSASTLTQPISINMPLDLGLEFVHASPSNPEVSTIGDLSTSWDIALAGTSVTPFTATYKRSANCSASGSSSIDFFFNGVSAINVPINCQSCNYDPTTNVSCDDVTNLVGETAELDFAALFPAGATNFSIDKAAIGADIHSATGEVTGTLSQGGSWLTQIYAEVAGEAQTCAFEWVVNDCQPDDFKDLYLGLPGLSPIKISGIENAPSGAAHDVQADYQIDTAALGFPSGCCLASPQANFDLQGTITDPATCVMKWDITADFANSGSSSEDYEFLVTKGTDSDSPFTHNPTDPTYDCNFRIGNHAGMTTPVACTTGDVEEPVTGGDCSDRPAPGRNYNCSDDNSWHSSMAKCSILCEGGASSCSGCTPATCPTNSPGNQEFQCVSSGTNIIASLFANEATCEAGCGDANTCSACNTKTCLPGDTLRWRKVTSTTVDFTTSFANESLCEAGLSPGQYCVGICRPETSPPAGSVIHLDAELGVSVSGGRVDEWDDQSAENQAVTQGTAADRPDDNANALNGIGGLRFDGGSDRLRIADDPEINNPGTFTEKSFGIVFRTGTDVDTRQVVYQQGGGTRGISIYIEDDDLVFCVWNQHSGGVQEFYDPICVEDTVTASTAYYTTYRFEGTSGLSGNITMTINENAEETTGGLGILYGHSGDVALGGVEGSAHFADNSVSHSDDGLLGGTIYEFISYNDNLSNTNRDKLKSYLRHKYGLD